MTRGSSPGMKKSRPCRPGTLTRRCERFGASLEFTFTGEGRPARRLVRRSFSEGGSFSVGEGEGEPVPAMSEQRPFASVCGTWYGVRWQAERDTALAGDNQLL
jgi:hypothetical protein